ncbi:MAG: hypothetical protein IPK66_04040 [Rhodospirillales bacterium]|nr:hypothetical protein [Rhodospirillales bacterium]
MIQRAANKDNWQSDNTHIAKANLEKSLPKESKITDAWALHHKMSKEKLTWLAEKLVAAILKKSVEAKAFWAALREATMGLYTLPAYTGNEFAKQSAQKFAEKALWNIPANLELGPANTIDNPGMSADPNTVPDLQEPRGRRMTFRSDQFAKIEAIGDQNEINDSDWTKMTVMLNAAVEHQTKVAHQGSVFSAPLTEQWEKKGSSGFRRKGTPEAVVSIYYFPGEEGQWDYFDEFEWMGVDTSGFTILSGAAASSHITQYPK